MKLIVKGFEWDEGNIHKCQKHGLSISEIEDFFYNGNFVVGPDIKHSAKEKRFFAVGRTSAGRAILAVFVERNNFIRPVSIRYMHVKEWRLYEKKDTSF